MVKVVLTEVRNLGMMVNKHNSHELIDHCMLRFTTKDGEEVVTYPLAKTCHASSRLGKYIKALLGRSLTKTDYVKGDSDVEYFDSSVLIGKEMYAEITEGGIVTEAEASK